MTRRRVRASLAQAWGMSGSYSFRLWERPEAVWHRVGPDSACAEDRSLTASLPRRAREESCTRSKRCRPPPPINPIAHSHRRNCCDVRTADHPCCRRDVRRAWGVCRAPRSYAHRARTDPHLGPRAVRRQPWIVVLGHLVITPNKGAGSARTIPRCGLRLSAPWLSPKPAGCCPAAGEAGDGSYGRNWVMAA
jgi:hypothetical protein